MHVGIDCRLPSYRMGGISQYTIQLITALSELAGDERYTIFHKRGEPRQFAPTEDSRFSRSDLITPCHHRLERWALAAELLPHRLDVYHSPDFIPPAAGAGRRVITVHDLTFLHYPEFLTGESRRYYAGQIDWAVAAADHISVDSDATRADLLERFPVPPHKVTTVHLAASPIHTAAYAPADVAATLAHYGLPRWFILFVGTLEPRKNLPTLLRAYRALLDERAADPPLVLVGGKGWIYDEIFQTIVDLGLTGRVHHLSDVDDVALAHLYRAAGVLAMPSHYEGFGLPALEAMHAGCPVIVSDRGSLPEVVGDAALLVPPDDVAGWTAALRAALSDSDLASRLRAAGPARAAKFTWRKTAEATLAIYRQLG